MTVPSFKRTSLCLTVAFCGCLLAYSSRSFVRFIPKYFTEILIGQPTDHDIDLGAAIIAGKNVGVDVYSGSSVLNPGIATGTTKDIGKLPSPLSQSEVGTIRCIGLNVRQYQMSAISNATNKISVCPTCK